MGLQVPYDGGHCSTSIDILLVLQMFCFNKYYKVARLLQLHQIVLRNEMANSVTIALNDVILHARKDSWF